MSPFDLPKQRAELEELKQLQQKEDFWNDVATAQKVSRQAKHIEDRLDFLAALEKDAENLSELIALRLQNEQSILKTLYHGFIKRTNQTRHQVFEASPHRSRRRDGAPYD